MLPVTVPITTSPRMAAKGRLEPFTVWGDVPIHRAQLEGENTLEVLAGTNAPQGGDVGHGAQTVLVLHNVADTAIQAAKIMTSPESDDPSGLLFIVGGDSEAATLADALSFAAETIRRQIRENHGGES